MKTYRAELLLSLLVLIALPLFAGCAGFYADVAKVIPPGNYKVISATVTGKFSATQFTGENVSITPEGRMQGGHVHVRHSNFYVPLIEFDLQAADTFGLPATASPAPNNPNAPISTGSP